MAVLTVGANGQFQHIQDAINAAHAGDTINVQAGTYNDEYFTVNKALTIDAVGGMVHLTNDQNIPNGKAEVVVDANLTLNGFEFSGAKVADGNGAGIRYEKGNLVINNSYFHDNQDGLLAASDPTGTITITNSEFAHNGAGDGFTHNLYVNDIASLTIDHSYFHDAVVGHEIKSRAESTTITNTRIIDGAAGTASFSIDLPNGGKAVIQNDVIEQGPHSDNPAIIAYGEEGSLHANGSLQISNDTILNDLHSSSAVGVLNRTSTVAQISNDHIFGLSASQIASGPSTQSGNTTLAAEPTLDASHPWTTTGTGTSSTSTAAPTVAASALVSTASSVAPSTATGISQAPATGSAAANTSGTGGSSPSTAWHEANSAFDDVMHHLLSTRSAGGTGGAADLIAGTATDAAGEALHHWAGGHDAALHGLAHATAHADWFMPH